MDSIITPLNRQKYTWLIKTTDISIKMNIWERNWIFTIFLRFGYITVPEMFPGNVIIISTSITLNELNLLTMPPNYINNNFAHACKIFLYKKCGIYIISCVY